MLFSYTVHLQLWLVLPLTVTARVGGSSNSTFHRGYDFSIVFPQDCYANQKGTAYKLLLQNLITILLLLTNNLQEYSKAITH